MSSKYDFVSLSRFSAKKSAMFLIAMLALLVPSSVFAQKALILDATTVGGATSNEANAAIAAGFTVTDVSDATWESMTTAQFAAYQLIILADPSCVTGTGPITAALSNTSTWGSAVDGNVVVIGTDPTYHFDAGIPGAGQLMTSAVKFAGAQTGKTGLYAALSCYYAFSPDKTVLPLLDGITPDGSFTLIGLNGAGLCFNQAHIVATSPSLAGLMDTDLDNWSCSVHEAFDAWPPSFQVLAIADNFGSSYTASDGTVGDPYILARGATVISNIVVTPPTSTDSVGGSQLLTATVTTSASAPVVGTTATFHVIAGPDTGKTGTGVTNGSGQTTFNLVNSPATAGTDFINASFVNSSSLTETSGNVTVTWAAKTDTIPPTCVLAGTVAGPPKQILITVQDAGSGLSSVVVVSNSNDTISIPNFTIGTTGAKTITATKLNQSLSATVTLKVTDVAGNSTTCDPDDLTVPDDGIRGEHTLTNISSEEHFVTLQNGPKATPTSPEPIGRRPVADSVRVVGPGKLPTPLLGVDSVDILVNGKLFTRVSPTFNAETVDIGKAMIKGSENTVTVWANGPKGGSIFVLLHN